MQYQWTVWRCLVGEIAVDGHTFVLDEGELFGVRTDYLQELDATIDSIPASGLQLPVSTPTKDLSEIR
ncbi:MAG: DUF6119 family protein [Acidimicrobiales bacterium]